MSLVITTNENLISDFNISDYPACELFWPVSETSGSDLVDIAGGITTNFLSGLTFSGGAATPVNTGATFEGTTTSGTMPDLGSTKHACCIIVADLAVGGTITIGGNTGAQPRLDITPGILVTAVGADGNDTIVAASENAAVIYIDRTGDDIYFWDTDGTTVAQIGAPITPVASGAIDLALNSGSLQMKDNLSSIFGACVMNFETARPLDDIKAALSWCNYQWRNNNKVLPPWWRNVA